MTIFRRPVRSRPIRLFLITMIAVPLASLLALWAFAVSLTVPSAIGDHIYNAGARATTGEVAPLTLELEAEREQTYVWLITGRRTSEAPLLATRKLVDQTLPIVRPALLAELGSFSPDARSTLTAVFTQLAQLPSIRAAIDSGKMNASAAFQAYSDIFDTEFRFYEESIQTVGNSLAEVSLGAVDGSYALEMASREATLVSGALADRGQMSASARQLFASSAANRQLLMNDAIVFLGPSMRADFLSINSSPEYQKYQALEDQISASAGGSGPIPVNAGAWQAASGSYLAGMANAEFKVGTTLAAMSASLSDRLVTEAVLAGGAGLYAVVVSVMLLLWFGRKFTRDLTRLDGNVRGMALERLPRVVERLRRGDDVDVQAESPPPDSSTIREVARIAESFGTVQRAAVAAAVDQARMRKGVNQVFLNISMRSQSLLHRQLGMLDSMERRTSEPDALADLFRLDHLTTRMRRHAESLIILSGATPGRGWRDPVPVVDVLRAAVAEVEDYVRVDVVSESHDMVAGSAVNDVIHLIAELVENATVFSPPNTRIEVKADRVGTGLVTEIEDRGLGLSEEELAEINGRLASPPEFDLADSEQLGLFVVGRLAARHDIKVSLCPSVYGGTTAVLLMPFGVIVREEEAGITPSGITPPGIAPAGIAPPGIAPAGIAPAGMTPPGIAPAGIAPAGMTPPGIAPPWATPPPPPAVLAASPPSWVAGPMTSWPGAFGPAATRRQELADGPLADSDNGQSFVSELLSPTDAEAPGPALSGTVLSGPVLSGPVSSGPVSSGPVSSGSHLGMPIRVPQASLAPQLRARRKADRQATARDEPEGYERPPEAARNMMALMQQGWQRGRVDDLDHPEGAPGDGTD
jgi:signal transduction histidine kinase